MRYLSHLSWESRAKLMPLRRPSWLPRVELSVIEEKALPENASGLPVRTTVSNPASLEPSERISDKQDFRPAPIRSQNPATHSARAVQIDPSAPSEHRFQSKASLEKVEFSASQASAPIVRPAPATELIPPRPEDAIIHPRRIARNEEDQPAARTLQSVLAEVARRQEELELRYRAQQPATLVGQTGKESTAAQQLEPMGERDVRLNIGSIVVQVDPLPAASPLPPPRPTPPVRDTSDRWARSFLDR